MGHVLEILLFHHYTYDAEKSYASWVLQYICFYNKNHPLDRAARSENDNHSQCVVLNVKHNGGCYMDMSAKLFGDFCVACAVAAVAVLAVASLLTMVWVMLTG